MRRLSIPVCAGLLAASLPAQSAVTLAPPFRDNAVLQRDKPIPVWGRAEPGEKVSVTFRGQSQSAEADSSGRWRVDLAPLPASAEPADLTATGSNTVRIGNVLVGEVWICAGQSNMAWTVQHSLDGPKEAAAARHPLIRHFKVPLAAAASPEDAAGGAWEVCSPETAGKFSAVAYFFGRELERELQVPIGLLNISYGGSPIESWMSPAALRSDPAFPAVAERLKLAEARYPAQLKLYEQRLAEWQKAKETADKEGKRPAMRAPMKPSGGGTVDRFTTSALYHAMLHPFLPFAVRGILWFQGEANFLRSDEYRTLFPTMIRQWRAEFGQGDLPFYYVQLANQARLSDTTGVQFAFQRDAQSAALALPNTGFAVTADIGDPGDPHFKNKQEAGRRLALVALAKTYGRNLGSSGPSVRDIRKEQDAFVVAFDHAAGLTLRGDAPKAFELAGEDRVFHPAAAEVEADTVIVKSPAVPAPAAIRYAWHNNPGIVLYNAAGLPAAPFRSDTWPAPKTEPDRTSEDLE